VSCIRTLLNSEISCLEIYIFPQRKIGWNKRDNCRTHRKKYNTGYAFNISVKTHAQTIQTGATTGCRVAYGWNVFLPRLLQYLYLYWTLVILRSRALGIYNFKNKTIGLVFKIGLCFICWSIQVITMQIWEHHIQCKRNIIESRQQEAYTLLRAIETALVLMFGQNNRREAGCTTGKLTYISGLHIMITVSNAYTNKWHLFSQNVTEGTCPPCPPWVRLW